MKQEVIERTVREWVLSNPDRGARTLCRLANAATLDEVRTVQELADALIAIAGKMEIAETRIW